MPSLLFTNRFSLHSRCIPHNVVLWSSLHPRSHSSAVHTAQGRRPAAASSARGARRGEWGGGREGISETFGGREEGHDGLDDVTPALRPPVPEVLCACERVFVVCVSQVICVFLCLRVCSARSSISTYVTVSDDCTVSESLALYLNLCAVVWLVIPLPLQRCVCVCVTSVRKRRRRLRTGRVSPRSR